MNAQDNAVRLIKSATLEPILMRLGRDTERLALYRARMEMEGREPCEQCQGTGDATNQGYLDCCCGAAELMVAGGSGHGR